MTGTKRTGNNGGMKIGSISLVLSGIALATTFGVAAIAAGTKPLPIERIGLDNARQLVIEFAAEPGAFPTVPNVLDLPGPNHRMVVDFVDATIDKARIPSPDEMITAMTKVLPAVRAIRYSIMPNTAKPTARIVIDLPEDLKVTPRVVKVEETSVTINLGEDVKNLVIPTKPAKGKVSSATTRAAISEMTSTLEPAATPEMRSALAPAATSEMTPAIAPRVISEMAPAVAPNPTSVVTPALTSFGQPTVSADGETVALKPEQKLDETKVPVGATKAAGNAAGWDWNTPVENELASKIAETKSMGDGSSDPLTAPLKDIGGNPVKVKMDARVAEAPAERELVREVEAAETAKSSATKSTAAFSAPLKETEVPVALAPIKDLETTQAIVQPVKAAVRSAPVAQVQEIETTPVAMSDIAPAAVTNVASPSKSFTKIAEAATETATSSSAMTDSQSAPAAVDAAVGDKTTGAAPEPETTNEALKTTGPALSLKLYNSAVRNHLSGKLPEAINDYKGALAANPSLAEAHSNLGLIYNQQHDYAGALSEFHKALAINPKDAITYNGIGAALRAEKDLLGAIKNWQTAVDIDPKLATAHYNLGTAYEIQKDYDRALEAYKDAVTNDYRLGEAYYRMGLILQQKHRLDDAETQFKEALKVNANSEYSEDAKQRLTALKTQKK
jgi:Flp pilus assembly protein TadD